MAKITVLKNGLRIVSERLPNVRSVGVGIWITTGSQDEPSNLAGISHFIEHMLFKGTEKRSARDIAVEIDSVGGRINGFTEKEMTCCHAHLLGEHLPLAVDILSDIVRNPAFRPEDVWLEKNVVLEEINRYEDSPEEQVCDMFLRCLWGGHPLGRPILGSRKVIERFTSKTLRNYIQRRYTARRVIVSAAGAVDHEEFVEVVKERLSDLPSGEGVEIGPPQPRGGKMVFRRRRDIEQVHVCMGVPACSYLDERRYAQAVLDAIFGASVSSRLFQEVREKRGLAYVIGSQLVVLKRAGVLEIYAAVSPKSIGELISVMGQQIRSLAEEGPALEEVERAKSHLKGSFLLALERPEGVMIRLARGLYYLERVVPLEETIEKTERVTLEDVKSVARELFSPDQFCVAALGPEGKGRWEDDFRKALKESLKV